MNKTCQQSPKKDFWSALDESLSNLRNEYSNISPRKLTKSSSASANYNEDKSLHSDKHDKAVDVKADKRQTRNFKSKQVENDISINCANPIMVVKLPVVDRSKFKAETSNNGGGVNHLNLIQIKGNPAHSWQPKLVVDQKNETTIVRAAVNCVKVNKLLLKHEDVIPSHFI